MKITQQQRDFVKSCVAGYLDNKKGTPHTSAEMAKWSRIAMGKAGLPTYKVTASLVSVIVNELRDEGYYIVRDTKGKGYRCECGFKNGTPNIRGILDSLDHERNRVAESIKNNVIRPMCQIQQTVISNVPIDEAMRLMQSMKSTATLDDALGEVKRVANSEYRIVPVAQAKQITA